MFPSRDELIRPKFPNLEAPAPEQPSKPMRTKPLLDIIQEQRKAREAAREETKQLEAKLKELKEPDIREPLIQQRGALVDIESAILALALKPVEEAQFKHILTHMISGEDPETLHSKELLEETFSGREDAIDKFIETLDTLHDDLQADFLNRYIESANSLEGTFRDWKRELTQMERVPSERDIELLAVELARLTGKSPEYYKTLSVRPKKGIAPPGEDKRKYEKKTELVSKSEELTQRLDALRRIYAQIQQDNDSQRIALIEALLKQGRTYTELRNLSLPELIHLSNLSKKQLQTLSKSLQNCINTYRSAPWINAKVTGIWISGSRAVEKYTVPDDFVRTHTLGIFRRANTNFLRLLCMPSLSQPRHHGTLLTLNTLEGDEITVRLVYTVTNLYGLYQTIQATKLTKGLPIKRVTVLIQDEQLIRDELNWRSQKQKDEKSELTRILNTPINIQATTVAQQTLSNSLQAIDNRPEYRVHSD